jgi:hypothetical protein
MSPHRIVTRLTAHGKGLMRKASDRIGAHPRITMFLDGR